MADTKVTVCDGKYTFVLDGEGDFLKNILRYDEPWSTEPSHDIRYGRAIGALAAELNDARSRIADLENEVLDLENDVALAQLS